MSNPKKNGSYTYKTEYLHDNPPTGEFANRFSDGTILDQGSTRWEVVQRPIRLWSAPGKPTSHLANELPQFNFNQMTAEEFFKYVTSKTDNMYAGMIERIGRTTIWADDLADNGFLRFMKSPLEYGAAIEDGYFDDIPSRLWVKNYQSDTTNANPLFKTHIPTYKSSVAEVNFSREIPMKMSDIEFRKCCQTAETVGDVAGALVGKVNTTFIDDMYEACKQYFLGCLRFAPEPESGLVEADTYTETDLKQSPMVEVIDYRGDKCSEDLVLSAIHKVTDSEFYYKSHNYNPYGKYTLSKNMTLVMPKKWNYPLFLEKFAATYHPEYIKLGTNVEVLYVDAMPTTLVGMYPKDYEFLGMLVDDRALGITPLNGGFSVNTFYNPQDCSTSYFGHYEFIMSFLPFFNRKYLFTHKLSS